MTVVVSSRNPLGDLIIRQWDDGAYNREAFLITLPAGVAATAYNVYGMPIKTIARASDNHYTCVAVISGDEANATGIIIANALITVATAGTTTKKYAGIARGPIVINKDVLPLKDPAGNNYNIANLASALQAKNIVPRAQPDVVTSV